MLYQIGLKSGRIAKKVSADCAQAADQANSAKLRLDFPLPTPQAFLSQTEIVQEIVSGQARLFGGDPVPISLSPRPPLDDWSAYETGKANWGCEDPKFIWEPARFGWSFTLGRAYHATNDEKLAVTFWQNLQEFSTSNPPTKGPNWASAQEVALRLIAFCFSVQIFARSPQTTPDRLRAITRSIAEHAARIPPTMNYARAQGNNHLLAESAGIFTAGIFLQDHPMASVWRKIGWQAFHQGLHQQIADDGTYAQHSSNYHRLMLELSLWMFCLSKWRGFSFPATSLHRLAAATRWLFSMTNPSSGLAPNLGSNDGAHFLPLSICSHSDMRPTLQAASRAFLNGSCLPSGPWDELSTWIGLSDPLVPIRPASSQAINRIGTPDLYAYLRTVRFISRPNHADQLQVDFWLHGNPMTLDAGSYRYTAPSPWNNSLAGTLCHNTLSVDNQDQMVRAGKFLWLNWAQSTTLPASSPDLLSAETDAYANKGITHRRTLQMKTSSHWIVRDEIIPTHSVQTSHSYTVHWLLPDVPWTQNENQLHFIFGQSDVFLSFSSSSPCPSNTQIICGSQLLSGSGEFPAFLGWHSPTYNTKLPALSIRFIVNCFPPAHLQSEWVVSPTIE